MLEPQVCRNPKLGAGPVLPAHEPFISFSSTVVSGNKVGVGGTCLYMETHLLMKAWLDSHL